MLSINATKLSRQMPLKVFSPTKSKNSLLMVTNALSTKKLLTKKSKIMNSRSMTCSFWTSLSVPVKENLKIVT